MEDGAYQLRVLVSDDKWTAFPKSNNGRAITLVVEGQVRDIINPWAEVGFNRAALDLKYCVNVTGGAMEVRFKQTEPWGQKPIVSGIEVRKDPGEKCRHSIYERHDTWYTGPLMDPFAPKNSGWVYAINSGGGPFLSSQRIYFSVDQHYQFDLIPDGQGGKKIGWHGNVDWNDSRSWSGCNPNDVTLFKTRRITNNEGGMAKTPAYKIPLSDGWYLVYFLMGERPYGKGEFTFFLEEGEAGEQVIAKIKPMEMAGGTTKAVVMARYVHVTGNFFNLKSTVQVQGDGTGALIHGIMIKPYDGTPTLPNIQISVFEQASVVPPAEAVVHPCIATNTCHLGTSYCSNVETDTSKCAVYVPDYRSVETSVDSSGNPVTVPPGPGRNGEASAGVIAGAVIAVVAVLAVAAIVALVLVRKKRGLSPNPFSKGQSPYQPMQTY
jgi:hypothetical protein